jgi:DNA-3-methyladenine glycosylase II
MQIPAESCDVVAGASQAKSPQYDKLLLMIHGIHNRRSRKLPFNPDEALAHLRKADPKLCALIDRAGPFTLKLDPAPSPFESLLESILYQQLHGKAAAAIHARVRECYKGDPSPKALIGTPDEILRACGVSFNKIKAMKDLAAKTLDGTVPTHAAILKMSDADIVERLTEVRGIGPWTVEMLLIFRMGRPDVLPVSDYGVRKGYALTFMRVPKTRAIEAADLPEPDVVFKRGRRWAPFRSVASWYLWRACDLVKNTAPAGRSAKDQTPDKSEVRLGMNP